MVGQVWQAVRCNHTDDISFHQVEVQAKLGVHGLHHVFDSLRRPESILEQREACGPKLAAPHLPGRYVCEVHDRMILG